MADKNIQIQITTTADTAGAEKTVKIIDEVVDHGKKITPALDTPPGKGLDAIPAKVRPAIEAVDKLVDKAKQASVAMVKGVEVLTDKAKVAEFAFYDLDAALLKSSNATETFTAGVTKLEGPVRNNGRAMLLFSQGFEDAQYGISAVLNNMPGLVMAIGGTAGLAGAVSVAAVGGSILYKMLGGIGDKSAVVAESLTEVSARVDKVSKSLGDMETDRFNDVGKGIDAAREAADALKQSFSETNAAEALFATATLDNAAKIKIAETNIATALGLQVDHYKELSAIAEAESQKRNLAASQAIDLENQKLQKADEEIGKRADILSDTRNRYNIEESNLVTLRAQLTALREQETELKKIAAGKADLTQPLGPGLGDIQKVIDPQKYNFEHPNNMTRSAQGYVADAAQKKLDSEPFQIAMKGTQERVDQLEKALENLADSVPRAENAVQAAKTKVEDLQVAVATNIQRITDTLSADTLVAQSETLVKTSEQSATDLKDAMGKIESSTQSGVAAKNSILAATADSKIIGAENAESARNLQSLIGQIQSGQASYNGNLKDLLILQRELAMSSLSITSDINRLKATVESLKSARNR